MERAENIGNDNDRNPYLPHELIIEDILPRLPVKTIFRFRSVCKLWYTLPCDTKFVGKHLNRSLVASSIMIVMSQKTLGNQNMLSFHSLNIAESGIKTNLMLTIPLHRDVYAMELSCHGLVCFSTLHRKEVYVCNPSTQEVLKLPKVSFDGSGDIVPSKVVGFGFDRLSKKYKVLCAFQHLPGKMKCFIYTLDSVEDGSWRQLDDIPGLIQPMQNAYLNGVVHWMTVAPNDYTRLGGIISFSFEDEKYRVLPLPNCRYWRSYSILYGLHSSIYLNVIGGYLRLITSLDGSDAGYWTLYIWTLKDYVNQVWTRDHSVSCDIISDSMKLYPPVPIDIRNGYVMFASGKRLYAHDLETDISTEVNRELPGEEFWNMIHKYQPDYAESLVSPFGSF
ncbi:F-box protein [Thalictrum thalictroides]|uniref:F-box protein n=1 Tax=Thalictrum thalictroides TaxID=46969 RepID=A0A7J6WEP6_THATH|nr:F-box protein [Thalictrum thalictroides]